MFPAEPGANGQPPSPHSDASMKVTPHSSAANAFASEMPNVSWKCARTATDESTRCLNRPKALVIRGGEFGRTPYAQVGKNKSKPGRDHHHTGFSMFLAAGGVRGGLMHGATDELGMHAVENRVHVHDLHATILHLLGLDHERLTYRYSGRDFRLTDIHGRVVRDILRA